MSEKEQIRQIGFDHIKNTPDVEYNDNSIAFHIDINELFMENGSLRLDMFVILGCLGGKMQFELNARPYTLRKFEVLVCRPNDIIDNCLLSPDFEGGVLCLSKKGILEQISESDLWEKAFRISENPIVRVGEDSLRVFNLYVELLKAKVEMGKAAYYRETIVSIVRALLYELLSDIDNNEAVTYGRGLVRQRDVLFKRFVELLSANSVKPRGVSWYAERLYVSPKYLSTVCKEVSGRTAFDWISEYVQLDIRYWLKNSNKSIKEIADMLTFPNISFFGKYCRQHFGVSPTELRKQLRLKSENDTVG